MLTPKSERFFIVEMKNHKGYHCEARIGSDTAKNVEDVKRAAQTVFPELVVIGARLEEMAPHPRSSPERPAPAMKWAMAGGRVRSDPRGEWVKRSDYEALAAYCQHLEQKGDTP